MKLITTDTQLRAHIPNIIASVKGETPLIERLSLFLDLAEDCVKTTFTGESTFNLICVESDDNTTKVLTARLFVADALLRAIPSLDIVLTPNGFAVVNTSNLAPASKPRVDRLVGSMLTHRDDCIAALFPKLASSEDWLASDRADFFGATLFPDLSIVDELPAKSGSKWERYLELRSQVIDLEASLAEEWLSPELMSALRTENLRSDLTGLRIEIVRQVKAQVIAYLRSGSFNARRLADIVNIIRQDE
ncbi:MAG: hypothetical protein K2H63_00155 [Paramuribaculum sp.]|nr:hypothetical protein [Paramuribaculum sp.]